MLVAVELVARGFTVANQSLYTARRVLDFARGQHSVAGTVAAPIPTKVVSSELPPDMLADSDTTLETGRNRLSL